MHFGFGLIQLSACSLFMCECEHKLDTFDMHLVHCLFGGQQIFIHDVIQNIIYAFVRKNGHVIWKDQWYDLTSKVLLQIDF